jgi:hypothetical protein
LVAFRLEEFLVVYPAAVVFGSRALRRNDILSVLWNEGRDQTQDLTVFARLYI